MKLTIVLNNIRSGWNVGSVFRTCDALGADVILIGYTPKPVGSTLSVVKKTAIGAEEQVNWQHFNHFQEVLAQFPDALHLGIEISSSSQHLYEYLKSNSQEIQDKQIFLWFGNEISGLESQLVSCLQAELHLPMKGTKESLNIACTVSAAGYIFQYALEG
jgi:23S rRNA (guanosine2251-2'-O)-methyltransferase